MADRSCGRPRCRQSARGVDGVSGRVGSGDGVHPGGRPASSTAGYRGGETGRCSPAGRTVDSDSYLRLVEVMVIEALDVPEVFSWVEGEEGGATSARKNYFKISWKKICEVDLDLLRSKGPPADGPPAVKSGSPGRLPRASSCRTASYVRTPTSCKQPPPRHSQQGDFGRGGDFTASAASSSRGI